MGLILPGTMNILEVNLSPSKGRWLILLPSPTELESLFLVCSWDKWNSLEAPPCMGIVISSKVWPDSWFNTCGSVVYPCPVLCILC